MPSVLISGASVAGPALAYWLDRAGFAVTVVERAPQPRPGGQAIDVRGPALAVLDRMGLLDRAKALRTRMRGMSALDIEGREISRTEERTFTGGRFDSGDIEIFRDDLTNLLLEASRASAEYVYGDTIVALAETEDGVDVTFERAPPRRFDLVVGADGLHSQVRHLAFGPEAPLLRPLGVGLALFTTPNLLGLDNWQIGFRGEVSGYVIYPTRDNSELRANFGFGMTPEEYPRGDLAAQKALILQRCADIRGDAVRLLDALAEVDELYFGPLAQVRMAGWTKGRVCLIGDAAHCPSPFSGQGTSLALVGAFVLGRELAASPRAPERAFARYEERMRPFVLANQDMVSVERAGPIPEDVFERAKNAIKLDDLMPA